MPFPSRTSSQQKGAAWSQKLKPKSTDLTWNVFRNQNMVSKSQKLGIVGSGKIPPGKQQLAWLGSDLAVRIDYVFDCTARAQARESLETVAWTRFARAIRVAADGYCQRRASFGRRRRTLFCGSGRFGASVAGDHAAGTGGLFRTGP